jgi:hypothetical protein
MYSKRKQYNSWGLSFCGDSNTNSSTTNMKQRVSWFRAFCEYIGVHRWARGVIILQLVLMVVLFLCEAIYYLVGSFRFRDEHVGVWHIIFLSLQVVLIVPYFLLYCTVSRWYNLWDITVRTSGRDVLELNITLPFVVAALTSVQIVALNYYGVVLDLAVIGPSMDTLVAYRQINYMAGICAAVCCYVTYRCTPAFTRKASDSRRWIVQSVNKPTLSGYNMNDARQYEDEASSNKRA